MSALTRHLRRAAAMALAWALGGFSLGMLIELLYTLDPGFVLGPLEDIWPNVLALVALPHGLVFYGLLAATERGPPAASSALPRALIAGAACGLLVTGAALASGLPGTVTAENWPRAALVLACFVALGAFGGGATLLLTRLVPRTAGWLLPPGGAASQ